MYSGGSAVINLLPHTQLYAQLMQHRQARNDAFDQYIRNLNTKINPEGLRNQDRPVFNDKLAEWQKFGMDHRNEIQTRKNGADVQFEQGFQRLQNLISQSKGTEEQKKPLIQMLLDPEKRDRLGDEIIPAIHAHDQPLYAKDKNGKWAENPEWKPLDYNSVTFNPKPFDQDKYFKGLEDIKRMDMPPIVTTDPKTFTQTEVKNSVFDQDAKNLAAQRAVTEYSQNPSFKSFIDKLDPKQYNDVYKQHFGHDIQNPGDVAAAYTMKGLQQKVTTSKIDPDTFARQQAMESIRFAHEKALANYKKALTDGDKDKADLWIDNYIDNMVKDAKLQGEYKNAAGQTVVEKDIPLDATLSKALTKQGKEPDALRITADGQFRPIYYQKGEDVKDQTTYKKPLGSNGNYAVDKVLSVPISADQVKLALGKQSGVKQMNKEMKNQPKTETHPLPAGKPRTVKQGNYTYTYNESTGEYE